MNKGLLLNFFPDHQFEYLKNISNELILNSDFLIFDLDATLVFPETSDSLEEITTFFNNISNKRKCIILSNSRTANKRKELVEKIFNCEMHISFYKKPLKMLFDEIVNKYELNHKSITVVGDRYFTDIWFGNLNNATTVLLTKPLTKGEGFYGMIIRKIERCLVDIISWFL